MQADTLSSWSCPALPDAAGVENVVPSPLDAVVAVENQMHLARSLKNAAARSTNEAATLRTTINDTQPCAEDPAVNSTTLAPLVLSGRVDTFLLRSSD